MEIAFDVICEIKDSEKLVRVRWNIPRTVSRVNFKKFAICIASDMRRELYL